MPEPDAKPFTYLILRVVPSVERGERLNVGVVLFCRQRGFLGARVELDSQRLAALAPSVAARRAARASGRAGARRRGRAGRRARSPRCPPPSASAGWRRRPRTIVQASEVHTGLSHDPEATLDALFDRLVAVPAA